MEYIPSKLEVLEAHSDANHHRGVPIFNQAVCMELESDGFLVRSDDLNGMCLTWRLTYNGVLVIKFIRGEIKSMAFMAPNWVLRDATITTNTPAKRS